MPEIALSLAYAVTLGVVAGSCFRLVGWALVGTALLLTLVVATIISAAPLLIGLGLIVMNLTVFNIGLVTGATVSYGVATRA